MQHTPAREPLIPHASRRGLRTRLGIVFAMAVLIGLANWMVSPAAPLGRRLDVNMAYALSISLITWMLVDVGRFVVRGPLQSAAPDYWPRGWRRAAWLVAGIGSGYLLGTWIGDSYAGYSTFELIRHDPNRFTGLLVSSLIISALFVLFFYQRGHAETLARQAREAELRALQSQLEPHMLFNTLANLRVLIGLDPVRAQAMLDHLIAFLRTTLNASRSASQPLAAEFAHLDDYLALMAVRMGPRLTVRLNLPPELAQQPVPPLLLQPLVENAIKHGLEPKVDGGRIEVTAAREGVVLRLSVRDTGVGPGQSPVTGGSRFGLEQVRSRLATLYGGRATLALQPAGDAEGGALATITLPLE
jgi:signal transduction histidine kinase